MGNTLKFVSSCLQSFLEEMGKLKTPILPVGIFFVTTLCLVAWKDRLLSSKIKSALLPLSTPLHISPDCLHTFLLLFAVPLCFLLLVREHPKRYGLTLGKVKLALPLLAVFLVGFGVVGFLVGKLDSMATFYGAGPRSVRDASLLFLSYLITFWGWEFVTRGFLLLGLKRYVGAYALYIQLLPFVILHLGKPPFELYGSIFFGLVFGTYAYLVDSFIYCAIVHAWFALAIDFSIGLG